jgi:hypothetical protein
LKEPALKILTIHWEPEEEDVATEGFNRDWGGGETDEDV